LAYDEHWRAASSDELCARRYQRMLERKQLKAQGDVNLELNFAEPQSPQTDLI